ncbi:MAG TPA: hypothetical protein VFZ65_21605 [Planctomycetota bacterium]|nr:hypothetical protein [Planctomycetota bacterium]
MSLLRCSLPVLLALPIAAQQAWRLPERGAVEYRRTATASGATAESIAAVRKLEARDKAPDGVLPRLEPAAWLCHGELTPDQRAIADEPRDLRDVLRAAACDLSLRGGARVRYRRLVPFGDLVVTGRVDGPDEAGRQGFTLALTTEEPEVRPGETKAALGRYIRPLCKYAASGELSVTRQFDAEVGALRSFRAELTLVYEQGRRDCKKLVLTEQWDLVAVHENQDAAFRADVAKAIRSGAKWVRAQLSQFDRRYMKDQANGERSYGSGRLALALLTLLHADTPGDDPVVVGSFDELRRRVLVDTYTLGVALMAMAARYAPPNEADMLRTGVLAAPKPRELSADDRQLAAEWLARLRQNLDTRVDEGYRLRFNYIAGPRFDNSVNQYGLLGLYAAKLCQLDVPASVWRSAAAHLLEVQADDGGRSLRLELVTHRELAAAASGNGKGTRAGSGLVPTRGYAYQGPEKPAYGSMTTAGITGLVIARSGMVQTGLAKADVMPKVDAAILSGFAWLAAEFHVRSNPGYIDRADDNWYYYLYGLERACEIAGVALVQGRDWYFEGALQLMPQQEKNGAFRLERAQGWVVDSTCFAVLFLKKATLPAITGG